MSIQTKIAAVTLAALTLGTTVFATTGEAQARHGWGWGLGAGIAAGALIGAAAASSAYAGPGYGYYGPRCRWVRQYDNFGYYAGTVKICNY